MRLFARFCILPRDQRRLLVRAFVLLSAFRLGLWVLPFRLLRRSTQRQTVSWRRDQISWALAVASRYVPDSTCLVRALAAKSLLQSAGFPARLEIGVSMDKGFEAHAWVESDGFVVAGANDNLNRFKPLGFERK